MGDCCGLPRKRLTATAPIRPQGESASPSPAAGETKGWKMPSDLWDVLWL